MMNFQPTSGFLSSAPDNTRNIYKNQQNQNCRFNSKNGCSPLLRANSPLSYPSKSLVQSQQRTINEVNTQFPSKNIHNRLGKRNTNRFRNNNFSNNVNSNSYQKNDYVNRKRIIGDSNLGPIMTKKRWNKNNGCYGPSLNNSFQNTAQNRLNRIRSNQSSVEDDLIRQDVIEIDSSSNFNELQDIDAQDITVKVVNNIAQKNDCDDLTRFKMKLDPKTQAAIKVIQQKIKDKQVIFPFPVTPNATGISLHDRFTVL